MHSARGAEYELACIGDNEPAGAQYYYDQPADMILYKGLASARLGEHEMAQTCFDKAPAIWPSAH